MNHPVVTAPGIEDVLQIYKPWLDTSHYGELERYLRQLKESAPHTKSEDFKELLEKELQALCAYLCVQHPDRGLSDLYPKLARILTRFQARSIMLDQFLADHRQQAVTIYDRHFPGPSGACYAFRNDHVTRLICDIGFIQKIPRPEGGFTIYPKVSATPSMTMCVDASNLSDRLCREAGILILFKIEPDQCAVQTALHMYSDGVALFLENLLKHQD